MLAVLTSLLGNALTPLYLVTVACLLIGFHLGVELNLFPNCFSASLRCTLAAQLERQDEDQKKTLQIIRMTDQARVQIFKVTARLAAVAVAFCLVALLPFITDSRHVSAFCFVLVLYTIVIASLLWHGHWTPSGTTCISTLLHLIIFARTCRISDPGFWFIAAQHRVFCRLVLGIVDMNYKRTFVWNAVFFIANAWKTVQMQSGLQGLELTFIQIITNETFSCGVVWFLSYTAEVWIRECVQIAMEVSVSHNDQAMVSHLLSAFCDAQVKLGPDLRIVEPHKKLSQILLGTSCDRHNDLQGKLFSDYLQHVDKTRFKAFIVASSQASTSSSHGAKAVNQPLCDRPKTLPSAFHVHMRDFTGRDLPAKLYHSAFTTHNGELRHLIGICVDCHEQVADTKVYEDQTHMNRVASSKGPSSNSSSSSKMSLSSSMNRLMVDRLSIQFDPFHWSVRSIYWYFADSVGLLKLDECLIQPDGADLRLWIQNQVNFILNSVTPAGNSEPTPTGSMTLCLPQIFGTGHMVLSASSTFVDFEDLDNAVADNNDEYSFVTLHLKGLQMQDCVWQTVMSTIQEANEYGKHQTTSFS